jgi:hypothetical protein
MRIWLGFLPRPLVVVQGRVDPVPAPGLLKRCAVFRLTEARTDLFVFVNEFPALLKLVKGGRGGAAKRSIARFCSDRCRNQFHNDRRASK